MSNPYPQTVTPVTGRKTVAATGTPEALSATHVYAQSVELVAQKAQGSANAGTVYVGWTSGNGEQDRPLAPGDTWVITAPDGKKLDLAEIYIDPANPGDGVTWTAV